MNNKITRDLSYGVYVVGCIDEDRKVGCIANSVMQITSNPSTIAISINHDNYTNKCIKESNKFSLSILNEESNSQIIGKFGYSTSKEIDKFKEFDHEIINDLPVIKDSNGYIICEVISTLETDTHTIFVGNIVEMKRYNDKTPMTYKYYQDVLKGKSPKNAPTYENIEEEIKSNQWKCTICGYIYKGEELPLDFKCPICGATKEAFEKVS